MRRILLLSVIFFLCGILFIPSTHAGGKGEAIPTELKRLPEVTFIPDPVPPFVKKPCEPKKTVSQTTSGGLGFFTPVMVGSFCGNVGGLGGGGVVLPSSTNQRVDIDLSECE